MTICHHRPSVQVGNHNEEEKEGKIDQQKDNMDEIIARAHEKRNVLRLERVCKIY